MKEISRFFSSHTVISGTSGSGFPPRESANWRPPIDVYERKEGLVVVAELPGVSKDRIQVQVLDQRLSISGIRPMATPANTLSVHHMEIPYGAFAREIALPGWVNESSIEAEYRDGYLYITIGRKEAP